MDINEMLREVEVGAGLLRISTDKTDFTGKKVDAEETLRNHEEKITSYFKEMGWEYDLYKEVLTGGSEYDDRVELHRLLENIEKYQAIVCMELPRLARQGEVSQKIKTKVIKNQTLIITLNPLMVYDLANNSMDALMYDLGAALAEYDRRVASARVRANKMSMARQGLNSSGSVAYGYKRNPEKKTLEIFDPQAKWVRQIYNWFLEGYGQKKICDMLNDMEIKNKQGNRWAVQSIRYMLECPTYKGTLVAHNYIEKKGKMVATETVVKEDCFPAIISPEIWDKVQGMKKNKRERYENINARVRDKKHTAILSDLVFCECCGRKSTIKWVAAREAFYIIKCTQNNADGRVCQNGGSKLETLESAVLKEVFKFKEAIETRMLNFKTTNLEEHKKSLYEQTEELNKAMEKLNIEARVIRNMEKDYKREKESTGFSDPIEEEGIKADKKENQQQRMRITEKIAELKKKLEAPSPEQELTKLKEKLELIEAIEKNEEDLSESDLNHLLKHIILKVHYKRILPPEIAKMSNRNPIRNEYPADLKIEYID